MTAPKAAKKSRYKQAEGKHWIEVRVRSPQQLFDARDPAPFRERDLDDDCVAYIVASAREVPVNGALKIAIHIEEPMKDLTKDSIKESIHEFFAYQLELQRSELKAFLRRSQVTLVLGLGVLAALLSIAQNIPVSQPPGALGILREGLVIFGWVSVWKPIELILFDWYPMVEKQRLFRRLLEADIDVRFSETPT